MSRQIAQSPSAPKSFLLGVCEGGAAGVAEDDGLGAAVFLDLELEVFTPAFLFVVLHHDCTENLFDLMKLHDRSTTIKIC